MRAEATPSNPNAIRKASPLAAVRRWLPAGLLPAALLLGACARSTQPDTTHAINGHVRLLSTLIGHDSKILGTRTIDDADGIPVEALRGNVVVARTTTSGGAYHLRGLPSASYIVRAGVLTPIATATPIVVVAGADLQLSAPLVVTTVGDIYPAPNPIGPGSWIYFAVADSEVVRMVVRDVGGTPLRTLINGGQPAGFHGAYWDLTDDSAHAVTGTLFWVTYEAASGDRQFLLLRY